MQSTYQSLGIPDPVSATFVALFIILTLSSWAAGQDFGIFKIPNFNNTTKKRLKIIGPLLLTFSLLAFIPFWSSTSKISSQEDPTWKRNYQLFASRPFPDGTIRSEDKNSPDYGGRDIVFRPELIRGLNLLIIPNDEKLKESRDQLLQLVKNAPTWNEMNPNLIIVDSEIKEKYLLFKNLLRALSVNHGVDVERLEREKYILED